MKIAITASGINLDSTIDLRFGRAQKFIIYDMDRETFDVLDNAQNLNASQGAGIQAAQHVANSGARALITGHTGPKAFKVLETAGIPVYLAKGGTVMEAINQWKLLKLPKILEADVEGHWV